MGRPRGDVPIADERLPMGYDDFLDWCEEEGHRGEWVDGEVIVLEMPSIRHQLLVAFLNVLLSWYARRLDLGTVLLPPFEMLVRGGRSSRQPDLIFVAREHVGRLEERRLAGPADLAVEIISKRSGTRDRRDKLAEYAEAGIPEYWIFDSRPGRARAEFYRLGADGRYESAPLDADGRYHSTTLAGFWLDPAWLRQDPLPEPDDLKPLIAPAVWRASLGAANGAGRTDGGS